MPYIISSVRSALESTNQDTEVLVSDNHSTDGTADAVTTTFLGESRVRLVKPHTQLSMTRHFDFALGRAKSDWVTLHGGDDGLLPYFGKQLQYLIQKYPAANAFVSRRAYFVWPGAETDADDLQVGFHASPVNRIVNVRRELRQVAAGARSYMRTLSMYSGSVVSQELIQAVRRKDADGNFYRGSQPDMYSSFALLQIEPRLVRVGAPFCWIGESDVSNTFALRRQIKTQQIQDFLAASLEQDEQSAFGTLEAERVSVPLLEVEHLLLALARRHHFREPSLSRSDLYRVFGGALKRAPRGEQAQILQSCRVLGLQRRWLLLWRGILIGDYFMARAEDGFLKETARLPKGLIVRRNFRQGRPLPDLQAANAVINGLGFAPFEMS